MTSCLPASRSERAAALTSFVGREQDVMELSAHAGDVVRAQLEGTALAAAWAEGRAMTLDQILAYALDGGGEPGSTSSEYSDTERTHAGGVY